LILGAEDDGTLAGVQPKVGKASIRDWIEQKIPHLLNYPLSDFRVHTVVKGASSRIPSDREVVVIDVGDSALAPHQSKRDYIYYYRVGGRSVPAPLFYIELLRQRLTAAALEFDLKRCTPVACAEYEGGLFLETKLLFQIENVGRVAAYKWRISIKMLSHEDDEFLATEGVISILARWIIR